MKKLLALFAIFIASPALALDHLDLLIASYSTEDGSPVRLQHVMTHRLGADWLSLRGINNLDLDSDGDWTRIQLKPRVLATFAEAGKFSFHAAYQAEYFENRRFDRFSNRAGVGTEFRTKTFSVEVNYLPYDDYAKAERWDSYINWRYKNFAFNNVLWYVPKGDDYYEQATFIYKLNKRFSVQYQRQWSSRLDIIDRVGIAVRFAK